MTGTIEAPALAFWFEVEQVWFPNASMLQVSLSVVAE